MGGSSPAGRDAAWSERPGPPASRRLAVTTRYGLQGCCVCDSPLSYLGCDLGTMLHRHWPCPVGLKLMGRERGVGFALHFHRPPPRSCPRTSPITPQISPLGRGKLVFKSRKCLRFSREQTKKTFPCGLTYYFPLPFLVH